jgi:hypothetical protein
MMVAVMNSDFPYLEIPKSLEAVIGPPDSGTRMYRRSGSDEEVGPWFDAIGDAFPEDSFVSPGGVSMYAPVSRAGVHKRIKEGKLTMFLFHVVRQERTMFGYQKKLKELPYGYIPVSECKAWANELAARPERRAAEAIGDGDFNGNFLDKDPKDAKDKSVKYEHEQVKLEDVKFLVEVLVTEAIDRILPKKTRARRIQKRDEKMWAATHASRKKRDEQQ